VRADIFFGKSIVCVCICIMYIMLSFFNENCYFSPFDVINLCKLLILWFTHSDENNEKQVFCSMTTKESINIVPITSMFIFSNFPILLNIFDKQNWCETFEIFSWQPSKYILLPFLKLHNLLNGVWEAACVVMMNIYGKQV
jgi:hypothetical protein